MLLESMLGLMKGTKNGKFVSKIVLMVITIHMSYNLFIIKKLILLLLSVSEYLL